jgi:hypothetical protein
MRDKNPIKTFPRDRPKNLGVVAKPASGSREKWSDGRMMNLSAMFTLKHNYRQTPWSQVLPNIRKISFLTYYASKKEVGMNLNCLNSYECVALRRSNSIFLINSINSHYHRSGNLLEHWLSKMTHTNSMIWITPTSMNDKAVPSFDQINNEVR